MSEKQREMHYRPKGGMCATCAHVFTRDCSDLPFHTMPVLEVDAKATTVKCVEYRRRTGASHDAAPTTAAGG